MQLEFFNPIETTDIEKEGITVVVIDDTHDETMCLIVDYMSTSEVYTYTNYKIPTYIFTRISKLCLLVPIL